MKMNHGMPEVKAELGTWAFAEMNQVVLCNL